ncbi:Mur ligase family protein [Oceanicola sp. S124]|uniref:Mur ligase family protein n=1 Tax=Oceanicola sp. S124 TaxID=1042378 RepID=UPI0002557E47|nr:Mur ligase family protein [Oceanicola sp. S124]
MKRPLRRRLADLERDFRVKLIRPLQIDHALRVRRRAKGTFIGVTGSSAKSTTATLITAILEGEGMVNAQIFDNTINPLLKTIRASEGADFVVAETGVGGPGQMPDMARLLCPDVAVVTLIGREHFSQFRSREAIAAEKGALVAALRPGGLAVLNGDDDLASGMAARTGARVIRFGESAEADCRITAITGDALSGITVTLDWQGRPLVLPTRFPARHFALPVTAAAATGLALGVAPERIAAAIARVAPLPTRFSRHDIPGGPVVFADCAKAPRDTLGLAFEALRDAPAPRRRIVIGSISDYGDKRRKVQREAVEAALLCADEVVLVADRSHRGSVLPEAEAKGRLLQVQTVEEAATHVVATALPGEVILLKGSEFQHLERILLALAGPVRCWSHDCGVSGSCMDCGLHHLPFEANRGMHRGARRLRKARRSRQAPPKVQETP